MQQHLIDSEGIVFRDKKDGRYKKKNSCCQKYIFVCIFNSIFKKF